MIIIVVIAMMIRGSNMMIRGSKNDKHSGNSDNDSSYNDYHSSNSDDDEW